MTTNSSNPFDCLPDEIIEQIFLLIVYAPPIEPFNHVKIPPSSIYFSYALHEPYLRQTHQDLTSLKIVCRRFYNLLRSSTFWLRKCHHDHLAIVNEPLAIAADIDFQRLYFSNPFHPDYNLLGFDNNGQFWSPNVCLEKTPIGSDVLYDAFGQISSCFATSYSWGSYQRDNIQLLRKGEDKLSSVNPVIEFTVCVARRWDCLSECDLQLHFSDGHSWQYRRTFSNGDCHWHRITYRYINYLQNQMPTHVSMNLKGKDRQFWAGNYGAKFAQIKLRLVLRNEDQRDNQECEETLNEPDMPGDEVEL